MFSSERRTTKGHLWIWIECDAQHVLYAGRARPRVSGEIRPLSLLLDNNVCCCWTEQVTETANISHLCLYNYRPVESRSPGSSKWSSKIGCLLFLYFLYSVWSDFFTDRWTLVFLKKQTVMSCLNTKKTNTWCLSAVMTAALVTR